MIAPITGAQMLAAAERELKYRRYVYPKRIADSKMSPEKAAHEIRCMEAIIKVLEPLAGKERLL